MGKATIIEAQNSNTVYEQGSKGILGKLKGIFADYKHGTRNADRLYTEELWDNRVFGSEDVMEALETKTLFGELDHPEGDRCETLAKNAAISIVKLEKRPEEGVIYGEAEILDTPTGRIVKALADSGAKLGVSSRGMGEEIYENGQNIIDPNTYDFITFDVVVTPANTKARVALAESKQLNTLTESLKKEINECETENQLQQAKKVLESVAVSDKENLVREVENKLSKLDASKTNNKLLESNKAIALKLLSERLEETKAQLDESLEANSKLVSENSKLVSENSYYKDSKDLLKSKLKEAKCNENKEIESLKKELEEAKQLSESNKIDTEAQEETMSKLKEVHEKKIERLQKEHEEEVKQLKESVKTAELKFTRLLEANKILSKNMENSSKVLTENETLKKKIESLEAEKALSAKKLTESKLLESNRIKELEAQVKALQESKLKMEEAEDRFSKLAFNPMGTVKVMTENFQNKDDLSKEDIALFNALIGK